MRLTDEQKRELRADCANDFGSEAVRAYHGIILSLLDEVEEMAAQKVKWKKSACETCGGVLPAHLVCCCRFYPKPDPEELAREYSARRYGTKLDRDAEASRDEAETHFLAG